jgi:hypothetical protein
MLQASNSQRSHVQEHPACVHHIQSICRAALLEAGLWELRPALPWPPEGLWMLRAGRQAWRAFGEEEAEQTQHGVLAGAAPYALGAVAAVLGWGLGGSVGAELEQGCLGAKEAFSAGGAVYLMMH